MQKTVNANFAEAGLLTTGLIEAAFGLPQQTLDSWKRRKKLKEAGFVGRKAVWNIKDIARVAADQNWHGCEMIVQFADQINKPHSLQLRNK